MLIIALNEKYLFFFLTIFMETQMGFNAKSECLMNMFEISCIVAIFFCWHEVRKGMGLFFLFFSVLFTFIHLLENGLFSNMKTHSESEIAVNVYYDYFWSHWFYIGFFGQVCCIASRFVCWHWAALLQGRMLFSTMKL